jgi:hypothetical protein
MNQSKQVEIARAVTAQGILTALRLHNDELQLWSLSDIVDLLKKGYRPDQIIAGFTRPVFAD